MKSTRIVVALTASGLHQYPRLRQNLPKSFGTVARTRASIAVVLRFGGRRLRSSWKPLPHMQLRCIRARHFPLRLP
jgi:hypothetical protein